MKSWCCPDCLFYNIRINLYVIIMIWFINIRVCSRGHGFIFGSIIITQRVFQLKKWLHSEWLHCDGRSKKQKNVTFYGQRGFKPVTIRRFFLPSEVKTEITKKKYYNISKCFGSSDSVHLLPQVSSSLLSSSGEGTGSGSAVKYPGQEGLYTSVGLSQASDVASVRGEPWCPMALAWASERFRARTAWPPAPLCLDPVECGRIPTCVIPPRSWCKKSRTGCRQPSVTLRAPSESVE